MLGLFYVLDGWLGILYLIKDAAVLYENNKEGSSECMPGPFLIPAQNCHSKVQTAS